MNFFSGFPNFTIPYNLLNYTGVSMPITKVTEEDVKKTYNAKTVAERFMKRVRIFSGY